MTQRLILGGARPMRYGGDVQVYGRDRQRNRRRSPMRYGDDPVFEEDFRYTDREYRDPDMRATVARGPMSPTQRALAEELRLAREAGMLVEMPSRLSDARKQWVPIGDMLIPANDTLEITFLANFTFKMIGFRCASSQGPGLLLANLQIDRKSQLLRNGGIALELCSEVTTEDMIGDTANRGAEIAVAIRNFTAGPLPLNGAVIVAAVAR